jgi:hypothetical protein
MWREGEREREEWSRYFYADSPYLFIPYAFISPTFKIHSQNGDFKDLA